MSQQQALCLLVHTDGCVAKYEALSYTSTAFGPSLAPCLYVFPQGPMLMYGAWAALWDGLRKAEARGCVRHAAKHGVTAEEVWVHVTELTLLQVRALVLPAVSTCALRCIYQRCMSVVHRLWRSSILVRRLAVLVHSNLPDTPLPTVPRAGYRCNGTQRLNPDRPV